MKIPAHWTFNRPEVAQGFDDHVREQLPWYDIATFGTLCLGSHYLGDGSRAYDIGAANGNIARAFEEIIKARSVDFVSIEASKEMAKTWVAPGRLIVADVCKIPLEPANLIVSFLTLIFIPPEERSALLRRLQESLKPGGALILVERMAPGSGYPALAMSRLTLAQKRAAGADAGEIFDKEMSLIGVQRPVYQGLLVGFTEWFRVGDFAGWIYERPE